MPKGYIIFTEEIHDQAALETYAAAAVPTVIAAGGTALIAGQAAETAEGNWHGDTTVLLEFETLEAATAWYHSDDYQSIATGRHAAATSNVALFKGFALPSS